MESELDLKLKGKRVVVTCASSGVGLACAQRFLDEGADVFGLSRNPPVLVNTVDRKVGIHWKSCDITKESSIQQTLQSIGEAEVLVFVPIRERIAGLSEVQIDEMRTSIEDCLIPFAMFTQTLLPGMLARNYGRVICLLGASTLAPLWDHVLANISRVSVASLASGAAREFAAHGITFNNIILGVFDTPGLRERWSISAKNKGIDIKKYEASRKGAIPVNSLGDPQQCAALAAFLGSPLSSYLTGQSLRIDGGLQHCL